MVLDVEPESARAALEKVVERAVRTHCKYAINHTTPSKNGVEDGDGNDTEEDSKAGELREKAAKAKVKGRRQKRTTAVSFTCVANQDVFADTYGYSPQVANGRLSAYPKSPYIRSIQASEYRWLTQPELAPKVLSEDEGDAYETLDIEDEAEGDDESDEEPTTYSTWNYYQRQNSNGEALVRNDGSRKAFYEVRPPWHLKDSVSLLYIVLFGSANLLTNLTWAT